MTAVRELEDVKYAIGLEHALVGHASHFSSEGQQTIAIYSMKKLVEEMVSDGMDYEDAIEYIHFNILGAYLGPGMPAFLFDEDDDLEDD